MYFSKQSFVAFLALPAMASAGVRGTKNADKAHRQLTQTGKQEAAGTSFCTPNPLFVGADGLPRYIEDKVVLAVIEGVNSTEVDTVALSTTMGSAYNAAVDCSFSPGAIRELMGCEVIEGAAVASDADTEAYLIRCKEFFSNSVDNAVFLSDEDKYAGGICECSCGQGEEIFAQLVKNGECDCPCGFTPACECYAPFVDNFISGWNTLFTAATLDADITVSDVIEVAILDPNECNAGVETTFNGTAICPGNGTAAFASYFEETPSEEPESAPEDEEVDEPPAPEGEEVDEPPAPEGEEVDEPPAPEDEASDPSDKNDEEETEDEEVEATDPEDDASGPSDKNDEEETEDEEVEASGPSDKNDEEETEDEEVEASGPSDKNDEEETEDEEVEASGPSDKNDEEETEDEEVEASGPSDKNDEEEPED